MTEAPASVFAEVKLEWEGELYVVPPDRIFGAIFTIEKHVTLTELHAMVTNKAFRLTQISAAYAALLTYAGASKITAEQVYAGMFGAGETVQQHIMAACMSLLMLMIPQKPSGEPVPGEAERRTVSPHRSPKKRSR